MSIGACLLEASKTKVNKLHIFQMSLEVKHYVCDIHKIQRKGKHFKI
jgi:hypothetical protein